MQNTENTIATIPQRDIQSASIIPLCDGVLADIVLKGDLSPLTPGEKIDYYRAICARVGLDPATQPFAILKLQGKEKLYCDRGGCAQLNALHKVSHRITAREYAHDCYIVTAQASTPSGRVTESIGAVSIKGLAGEALCNSLMRCETKAKRRSTLDLLGLGILDETEGESLAALEVEERETKEAQIIERETIREEQSRANAGKQPLLTELPPPTLERVEGCVSGASSRVVKRGGTNTKVWDVQILLGDGTTRDVSTWSDTMGRKAEAYEAEGTLIVAGIKPPAKIGNKFSLETLEAMDDVAAADGVKPDPVFAEAMDAAARIVPN